MADRLGQTPARLKAESTSTDFIKWMKYLEDEPNRFHREDWFFAQLCMEVYLIRKTLTGGKVDRKIEDYLMKFEVKKEEDKPKPEVRSIDEMDLEEYQQAREAYSQQAMAEWMSAFGPVPRNNIVVPRGKKPPEKTMESLPVNNLPPTTEKPKRRKGVRVVRAENTPDTANRSELPSPGLNGGESGVSLV